jgi:hypothetical protein
MADEADELRDRMPSGMIAQAAPAPRKIKAPQ